MKHVRYCILDKRGRFPLPDDWSEEQAVGHARLWASIPGMGFKELVAEFHQTIPITL